jgi:AhpD family alkylhydroperoxidase
MWLARERAAADKINTSMALLRSLPENATLADLRRSYADLLDKLRPYGHRLMRGPSPLTPGQRELIAAFVSGVNSCQYCHGAHSLVARAFGIDEAVLVTSLDNIEIAPVDARLKPILRYVRKLTETPSRMTASDAAAVWMTKPCCMPSQFAPILTT